MTRGFVEPVLDAKDACDALPLSVRSRVVRMPDGALIAQRQTVPRDAYDGRRVPPGRLALDRWRPW